jgi:hypothetical protein
MKSFEPKLELSLQLVFLLQNIYSLMYLARSVSKHFLFPLFPLAYILKRAINDKKALGQSGSRVLGA